MEDRPGFRKTDSNHSLIEGPESGEDHRVISCGSLDSTPPVGHDERGGGREEQIESSISASGPVAVPSASDGSRVDRKASDSSNSFITGSQNSQTSLMSSVDLSQVGGSAAAKRTLSTTSSSGGLVGKPSISGFGTGLHVPPLAPLSTSQRRSGSESGSTQQSPTAAHPQEGTGHGADSDHLVKETMGSFRILKPREGEFVSSNDDSQVENSISGAPLPYTFTSRETSEEKAESTGNSFDRRSSSMTTPIPNAATAAPTPISYATPPLATTSAPLSATTLAGRLAGNLTHLNPATHDSREASTSFPTFTNSETSSPRFLTHQDQSQTDCSLRNELAVSTNTQVYHEDPTNPPDSRRAGLSRETSEVFSQLSSTEPTPIPTSNTQNSAGLGSSSMSNSMLQNASNLSALPPPELETSTRSRDPSTESSSVSTSQNPPPPVGSTRGGQHPESPLAGGNPSFATTNSTSPNTGGSLVPLGSSAGVQSKSSGGFSNASFYADAKQQSSLIHFDPSTMHTPTQGPAMPTVQLTHTLPQALQRQQGNSPMGPQPNSLPRSVFAPQLSGSFRTASLNSSLRATNSTTALLEDDDSGASPKQRSRGAELFAAPVVNVSKISQQRKDGVKSINQYVVGNTIGRGAYSKVKLCHHKANPEDRYAMKILSRSILKSRGIGASNGLKKFKREVAILKRLRHPHIIALQEVIDDPRSDKLYLILEYADGGELMPLDGKNSVVPDKYGNRHIPELECQRLSIGLIDALCYAHENGIAHRDIKPQNILIHFETPSVAPSPSGGGLSNSTSQMDSRSISGQTSPKNNVLSDFGQMGESGSAGDFSTGVSPTSANPLITENQVQRNDQENSSSTSGTYTAVGTVGGLVSPTSTIGAPAPIMKPKLADFGVSAIIDDSPLVTGLEGTVAFLAPEILMQSPGVAKSLLDADGSHSDDGGSLPSWHGSFCAIPTQISLTTPTAGLSAKEVRSEDVSPANAMLGHSGGSAGAYPPPGPLGLDTNLASSAIVQQNSFGRSSATTSSSGPPLPTGNILSASGGEAEPPINVRTHSSSSQLARQVSGGSSTNNTKQPADGPPQVDLFRGDVWSFGMTLFVLVTGDHPWPEAYDAASLYAAVRARPIENILKKEVHEKLTMSGLLANFLAYCLATDSAQRPTFHELSSHPWLHMGIGVLDFYHDENISGPDGASGQHSSQEDLVQHQQQAEAAVAALEEFTTKHQESHPGGSVPEVPRNASAGSLAALSDDKMEEELQNKTSSHMVTSETFSTPPPEREGTKEGGLGHGGLGRGQQTPSSPTGGCGVVVSGTTSGSNTNAMPSTKTSTSHLDLVTLDEQDIAAAVTAVQATGPGYEDFVDCDTPNPRFTRNLPKRPVLSDDSFGSESAAALSGKQSADHHHPKPKASLHLERPTVLQSPVRPLDSTSSSFASSLNPSSTAAPTTTTTGGGDRSGDLQVIAVPSRPPSGSRSRPVFARKMNAFDRHAIKFAVETAWMGSANYVPPNSTGATLHGDISSHRQKKTTPEKVAQRAAVKSRSFAYDDSDVVRLRQDQVEAMEETLSSSLRRQTSFTASLRNSMQASPVVGKGMVGEFPTSSSDEHKPKQHITPPTALVTDFRVASDEAPGDTPLGRDIYGGGSVFLPNTQRLEEASVPAGLIVLERPASGSSSLPSRSFSDAKREVSVDKEDSSTGTRAGSIDVFSSKSKTNATLSYDLPAQSPERTQEGLSTEGSPPSGGRFGRRAMSQPCLTDLVQHYQLLQTVSQEEESNTPGQGARSMSRRSSTAGLPHGELVGNPNIVSRSSSSQALRSESRRGSELSEGSLRAMNYKLGSTPGLDQATPNASLGASPLTTPKAGLDIGRTSQKLRLESPSDGMQVPSAPRPEHLDSRRTSNEDVRSTGLLSSGFVSPNPSSPMNQGQARRVLPFTASPELPADAHQSQGMRRRSVSMYVGNSGSRGGSLHQTPKPAVSGYMSPYLLGSPNASFLARTGQTASAYVDASNGPSPLNRSLSRQMEETENWRHEFAAGRRTSLPGTENTSSDSSDFESDCSSDI